MCKLVKFVGSSTGPLYERKSGTIDSLLSGIDVQSILPEESGAGFWIGTGQGLYYYDLTHKHLKQVISDRFIADLVYFQNKVVYVSDQGIGFFEQYSPNHLAHHIKGLKNIIAVDNFVFVTSNDGLIKFNASLQPSAHVLKGNNLFGIEKSQGTDKLWVGGYNKLFRYDYRLNQFEKHRYEDNCFGRIISIFENHGSDVWIGGENKLARLSNAQAVSKECSKVYFLAQYRDNQYFVVTEAVGISLYDAETNTSRTYDTPEGFTGRLIHRVDYSFDTLWIATDKGLMAINTKGKTTNLPAILANSYTLFVKQISDQELAVGTHHKGLFIYNLVTGQLTHYSTNDGLSSNEVLLAFYGSEGRIWAAASNTLHVKDKASKKFDVAHQAKTKIATAQEHKEHIYFTTMLHGFKKIDKTTHKLIRTYDKENNFISNNAVNVQMFGDNIYFQTVDELLRLNLNTGMFDLKYPVESRIFTHNSFLEIDPTRALVASPSGLKVIDFPKWGNDVKNKTVAMKVAVDGKDVVSEDEIHLQPDERVIDIYFNRTEILPTERLKCFLSINGGDKISLLGGKYTHVVNNITLGYSLAVSANCSNGFGDMDNEAINIQINVPMSYQAIYLLLALGLLTIALLGWHYKRVNPLKAQIIQEKANNKLLVNSMALLGSVMPETVSARNLYSTIVSLKNKFESAYGMKAVKLNCNVSNQFSSPDAFKLMHLTSNLLSLSALDKSSRSIYLNIQAKDNLIVCAIKDKSRIISQQKQTHSEGWKNFIRCTEAFDKSIWDYDLNVSKTAIGHQVLVTFQRKARAVLDQATTTAA